MCENEQFSKSQPHHPAHVPRRALALLWEAQVDTVGNSHQRLTLALRDLP